MQGADATIEFQIRCVCEGSVPELMWVCGFLVASVDFWSGGGASVSLTDLTRSSPVLPTGIGHSAAREEYTIPTYHYHLRWLRCLWVGQSHVAKAAQGAGTKKALPLPPVGINESSNLWLSSEVNRAVAMHGRHCNLVQDLPSAFCRKKFFQL